MEYVWSGLFAPLGVTNYAQEMTTRLDGYLIYLGIGGALVVAGVVIAMMFAADMPRWHRSGLALAGLGVLVGVLALVVRVPAHYVHPDAASIDHIAPLQRFLNNRLINGESLPDDVSALPPSPATYTGKLTDGWGRKLKIMTIKDNGVDVTVVASAGPDACFNTRDDIKGVPLGPEELTHARVEHLRDLIHARLDQHQPVPTDLQALAKILKLNAIQLNDGWSHPLRLVFRVVKGKPIYTMLSAGEDGKFDTLDDIHAITSYTSFPQTIHVK